MNQAMFSYLRQKLQNDFQSCYWEDSIARSYEENELVKMQDALEDMQNLQDEIAAFQKKTEQLLAEM